MYICVIFPHHVPWIYHSWHLRDPNSSPADINHLTLIHHWESCILRLARPPKLQSWRTFALFHSRAFFGGYGFMNLTGVPHLLWRFWAFSLDGQVNAVGWGDKCTGHSWYWPWFVEGFQYWSLNICRPDKGIKVLFLATSGTHHSWYSCLLWTLHCTLPHHCNTWAMAEAKECLTKRRLGPEHQLTLTCRSTRGSLNMHRNSETKNSLETHMHSLQSKGWYFTNTKQAWEDLSKPSSRLWQGGMGLSKHNARTCSLIVSINIWFYKGPKLCLSVHKPH